MKIPYLGHVKNTLQIKSTRSLHMISPISWSAFVKPTSFRTYHRKYSLQVLLTDGEVLLLYHSSFHNRSLASHKVGANILRPPTINNVLDYGDASSSLTQS